QQVCDIHTGDEQQKADRGEKHQQRWPHVLRQLRSQAYDFRDHTRISHGILLGKAFGKGLHLGARSCQADAASQPSQYPDPVRALALLPRGLSEGDRSPELCPLPPDLGKLEVPWHHANHVVSRTVQGDLSAHESAITTEGSLPQTVAQDHHTVVPRLVGRECSTQKWLNAEKLKDFGRDLPAFELKRFRDAGQGRASSGNGCHAPQDCALLTQVLEVGAST